MTANPSDLLLEWASEKSAGTWQELRDAWQWISSRGRAASDDPGAAAWKTTMSLSALAHVEISWRESGSWAAAPPVITMIPNSGGRALLTGARTRALFRPGREPGTRDTGLLVDGVEELRLWYDAVERPDGPTAVYIACDEPGQAEQLASWCGVPYTYSVSQQLASMLPRLRDQEAFWKQGFLPQGFQPERFDHRSLRWYECDDESGEPGLYRARTWGAHIHALITPTGGRYRVAREPAVYEVLRWERRQVLAYAEREGKLWVPSFARLPLLHERAAVLCTGILPRRWKRLDEPGHFYPNVPPTIAQRIASSLCQELLPFA